MNKLVLTSLIFFSVLLFAQKNTKIKTIKFEQLEALQKIEQKNVVIFIHTDWCNYCRAMQNTTFKNEKIIKLLNESFYFIDLNAEQKENILFNSNIFKYKPSGSNTGIHELAEQLALINKRIVYPTLCFLNPKNEIIFQYSEFTSAKKLETLLNKF